jgi:hypothetical protein
MPGALTKSSYLIERFLKVGSKKDRGTRGEVNKIMDLNKTKP